MSYETIIVERQSRVGHIALNRPKALNAINRQMAWEIISAARAFDHDADVGCILVTGSEKVFAAGADIREMQTASFDEMQKSDWFGEWEGFTALRKPTLAAVCGAALGGGCELAMMCDVILAADNAKFGQPEVKIGVIPGIGGTQRLARLIGRTKAMDLCLTGRVMDAYEALQAGLVSRVLPSDELMSTALEIADQIAQMPLPAVMMIKESIKRSDELSLSEGVRFERRLFHSLFATHDQREGMTAFLEKRSPSFQHK